MSEKSRLNSLLKSQINTGSPGFSSHNPDLFAEMLALIEQSIVVLSDMRAYHSKIFCGDFAHRIGISNYATENSIWENFLLEKLPTEEQDEKFRAELRFFHFLKKFPKAQRSHWHMVSRLRLSDSTEILHRLYYIYGEDKETIEHTLCVYGPDISAYSNKSAAINSVTGEIVPLTSKEDHRIISKRESQIIQLIDKGMSSAEIAEYLSISIHTVSRHRQQIIAKLQVKSSLEALRVAKTLHLI